MTGAHVAFVVVGAITLAVGGTMLARPSIARRLLKLEAGEAATYGLRIGGAMVAAFGLALIVLTLSFVATAPAVAP